MGLPNKLGRNKKGADMKLAIISVAGIIFIFSIFVLVLASVMGIYGQETLNAGDMNE